MAAFESVKTGDKVAVYGRGTLERRTVDRVTATMFTVADGGRKFSRKSGREHGSTSWSFSWAEPWTEKHAEELDARKADEAARALRRRLASFDWRSLDDKKVAAAVAALEAAGVLPAA
jgi:hypothetical protein